MALAYKLKFRGLSSSQLTGESVNLSSAINLTALAGADNLLVEVEFEVDSLSATNTITFATNFCRIEVLTDGSLRVEYRNQNNFSAPVTSAAGLISAGIRYKAAFTLSNTDRNARIFLDDVQVGVVENRWGTIAIDRLGLRPSSSRFNGSLYSVKAYQNGVLVNGYNPSIVLVDPNILVDEIGGNNGTMVNFPSDGSARVPYDDAGDPELKFSVLSIALGLNQNYSVNKLASTNIGSNVGQLDFSNENRKLTTSPLSQILDLDYYSECSKETRTALPIGASVENTLTNKKLSSFSLPIDFSLNSELSNKKLSSFSLPIGFSLNSELSNKKLSSFSLPIGFSLNSELSNKKLSSFSLPVDFRLNSELSSRKTGYSSINENLELVSILSYIRQDNPGTGAIDIRFRLGSSYTHKKSASTTYYTDLICDNIYFSSKQVPNILYQNMALELRSSASKETNSNMAIDVELSLGSIHSKTTSFTYSSNLNLYSEYQVSKATINPYQINLGQLSVSLLNFNLDNKQPIHKVTILSNETTVFTVTPIIGKEIILSKGTLIYGI